MSVYPIKGSRYWQFDFQISGYRFSGSTKKTCERDAKAVEAAEKAKARELVKSITVTAGEPLRLGPACDRWWTEVGSQGSERDMQHALGRVREIIGDRTFLHDITDDTLSRLIAERRQDRVRADRDDNGSQLWRPISNKRVNKTTTGLLRRVINRAVDNWDAVVPRPPKWEKHWLKETKRPIREIGHAEEAAISPLRRTPTMRRCGVSQLLRGNAAVACCCAGPRSTLSRPWYASSPRGASRA